MSPFSRLHFPLFNYDIMTKGIFGSTPGCHFAAILLTTRTLPGYHMDGGKPVRRRLCRKQNTLRCFGLDRGGDCLQKPAQSTQRRAEQIRVSRNCIRNIKQLINALFSALECPTGNISFLPSLRMNLYTFNFNTSSTGCQCSCVEAFILQQHIVVYSCIDFKYPILVFVWYIANIRYPISISMGCVMHDDL